MTELGWTEYPLPSRGILYDGNLPGGLVEIRKQTAREQGRLMQQGGGMSGKIDAIINSCLRIPESFGSAKKLLITDRFAVLLALRTKTFGPDYQFDYRCTECRAQVRGNVNIVDDFEEKVPEADFTEPIIVKLPEAQQTVHLRFLRGEDETTVSKNAHRMKLQSNDADDPTYLLRLAMQVVDVEEVSEGERAKMKALPFRQRWVEALSASDLIHLEDELNDVEPGIDTRVYLECPQCEFVNEMTMPFTAEFFRPRRSRSRND